MRYTRQAIKGFSWTAGIRIVTRVFSLVKNIIIARILSPYQFGAFGIATLVLVFVEIVTETGINTFLIQNREDTDKYISTSWLVSIIRGIIIFLAIIAASPFIAAFFRNSDSKFLLLLISFVPLLRGFINPSVIKFQKDLIFNKQFLYETSCFLVEVFFSTTLILITHKTEALIYGMLISTIFEVIVSFLMVKPTPRLIFNPSLFKKVIGYGKWITASTIFNYFYQHGDDIAVGRFLGSTPLGLYDMAYRLSLVPLSDVSDVISNVTFPVYNRISEEKERLRKAFLKTLSGVILITLPIGLIIFIFPREIITLVLGEKWLLAVPALKILGIFGFVRAVSSFSQNIFLSIGKQNIFTLISLVGLAGLALTIVPFVFAWGITGAAYSALFGTTLTIPVIFYYVYKFLW